MIGVFNVKILGSLVIFFSAIVYCKVVYRWEKANIFPQLKQINWRATSFALSKHKIFFTVVDIDKQSLGNGLVGSFDINSPTSPEVKVFPFPSFYRLINPVQGPVITPISVRVDRCARLWLLDAAVQNISGIQTKTAPGIHVISTSNDQIIRSFEIPASQWTSSSFFINFVIDTNPMNTCDESFGYFADFNRFHLLTYDYQKNKSFVKSHPFFSPDPLLHTPDEVLYNVRHQDLNGIFGLALVKNFSHNTMDSLCFHSLAGTHEFIVNTEILKSDGFINYNDIKILQGKDMNAQTGVSVFHLKTNTIFYAEINTKKIGVLRLKDNEGEYYRFDFNLKRGFIVDLSIYFSELWVLVDDKSEIIIHKFLITDITEKIFCSERSVVQSLPCNGTCSIVFSSYIFCLILNYFIYFRKYAC